MKDWASHLLTSLCLIICGVWVASYFRTFGVCTVVTEVGSTGGSDRQSSTYAASKGVLVWDWDEMLGLPPHLFDEDGSKVTYTYNTIRQCGVLTDDFGLKPIDGITGLKWSHGKSLMRHCQAGDGWRIPLVIPALLTAAFPFSHLLKRRLAQRRLRRRGFSVTVVTSAGESQPFTV
jgi:hypothetical protein